MRITPSTPLRARASRPGAPQHFLRPDACVRCLITLVCCVLALLSFATAAKAQTNGLRGDYFTNAQVQGTPAFTRLDPVVNFEWAGGSPIIGIPADGFSARWTGKVLAPVNGSYTFSVTTDDGARLWVNGVSLVDNWGVQAATKKSGTIVLEAGKKYDIVFEYFDSAGDAVAKLSWAYPSVADVIIPQAQLFPPVMGTGLQGSYFPTTTPTGTPTLVRIDPTVNFNWDTTSPAPSVSLSYYSVRWTGQILADFTELYTFAATADDGVRVWVNGTNLIDKWILQGATRYTGSIALTAGQKYDVVIEYYQGDGGASMKLAWNSPSLAGEVVVPQNHLFPTSSGSAGPGPLTIPNAGFETPSQGDGGFAYSPSGSSWSFSGAGISGAHGGFASSNPAPPEGVQVAFIQNTGEFSQPVSGFVPGLAYTLTFSAARRAYGSTLTAWKVTLDGTDIGSYSPPVTATNYTDYSASFVTDGGTFVLKFIGLNGSADNSVLIDNVRIIPSIPTTAPIPPSGLTATAASSTVINLAWVDASYDESGFKIERKTGAGGTYAQIGSVGANAATFSDTSLTPSTLYYYQVRATNVAGDSAYSSPASAATSDPKLSGTVIGTTGSYQNQGATRDKAMDGLTDTFFDAANADGNWVGLDLGGSANKMITMVRYVPRAENPERMAGGKFQGSSSADFSTGVVDLYTIPSSPAIGVYTTQMLSVSAGFRYVRYLSPTGGFGNVSEVEFYGHDFTPPTPPLAPSGLAAVAASSSQISLTWVDHSDNESGFKIERKAGSAGVYAEIATVATDTASYGDAGLAPSTTFYYRVRSTNSTANSAYSNEATATTQDAPAGPVVVNLQPVPFTKVQFSDTFWAPRIETNRTVSLLNVYNGLVNDGSVTNFARTANLDGSNKTGFIWSDSDVYKLLEGMANAIAYHPGGDAGLLSLLNNTVTNIVAAQNQRSDGYLDTAFQLANMGRNPGLAANSEWADPYGAHEDYCMGHMMEAAIAHYNMSGASTFINVARKNADYLAGQFGPSPKRSVIPGHQEVELALYKLWKVPGFGRQSDLDLAKFYLDERGRYSHGRPIYGEYCADLYPIRNSPEPVGHGVRAPYMWMAAADVGNAVGDTALLNASDTLWSAVVNKKMLVTGNTGHSLYNEGYAPDYDLSNDYVWGETCSAVATMMWSQRLGNIRGDSKYIDVMERIMYNGYAAGRSLNGQGLYYNNLMRRTSGTSSEKQGRTGIACCATNIIRTIPTISGYQYATVAGDGIWTHLYAAGQATVPYGTTTVGITQGTNYPWAGNVTMTINPATQAAFTLHLRIPDWATAGATATLNGQPVNMGAITRGYLSIQKTWAAGDVVQLTLPMTPRRIYMNSNVVADQGRVAIARGPLVYCLEGNDNPISVHRIVIPANAVLSAVAYSNSAVGDIMQITGTGLNADNNGSVDFKMIPYAYWDNRGPQDNSDMEVMIPETVTDAVTKMDRGQAGNATVSYSHKAENDSPSALNDGILPVRSKNTTATQGSRDQTIPRLTWWGNFGTQEWVQYDFPSPIDLNRCDVLWFLDAPDGGCDLPQSFVVNYWDGSNWQPVQLDANYTGANDIIADGHFSIVRFTPVRTTKLRMYVQSKQTKAAGILEWRIPRYTPLAKDPATGFRAGAAKQLDGTYLFAATVVPGLEYQVEESADLSAWVVVAGTRQTALVGSTALQWILPAPGGVKHFWRAVLVTQ